MKKNYQVQFTDHGKTIILGHYSSIEKANAAIKEPEQFFVIPLPKNLLNHYKKNAIIKDIKNNFTFHPLY